MNPQLPVPAAPVSQIPGDIRSATAAFIEYLVKERSFSPHTALAYEHDLLQWACFSAHDFEGLALEASLPQQ